MPLPKPVVHRYVPRLFRTVLGASLLFTGVAAPLSAQSVVGTVVERGSRQPVPQAAVVIMNADSSVRQTVFTDSAGRFSTVTEPGDFRLRVVRLGYAMVSSQTLPLTPSDTADFFIELPPRPVDLAGVNALLEDDWFDALHRRLDPNGFHQRRHAGGGFFLGPEEIDRRRPTQVADLLSTLPGVTAYADWRGSLIRGTSRAPRSQLNRYVTTACQPTIFLDGRPLTYDTLYQTIEQFVRPANLRGVEYYRNAVYAPLAFQPPMYGRATECAVIVLWTYVGVEAQ